MTFIYKFQGSWYIKCNSFHKLEHHWHFTWCYKVNFKTNLLKLETKQEEPYSYSFKCLNYKGDY